VEYERLASPLIVKALPLADGRFSPCALWLKRTYPDGEVFLKEKSNGDWIDINDSAADFDVLLAGRDKARFAPLSKSTLRQAFCDWLVDTKRATKVAP
jgi:CRISPR-associated protein Cmr1